MERVDWWLGAAQVFPSDVMDGADIDEEELGRALVVLGESVARNERLGIGNVEWLEWLAAALRFALVEQAESLEHSEVVRAEAQAEGD